MLKIKLAKINKILAIKGKINPKIKAIKPKMMRISNRGIMIKLASRELRDKLVKYQIIIGKAKIWALMVKAKLSVNSEGNFNLFNLERNMGIK